MLLVISDNNNFCNRLNLMLYVISFPQNFSPGQFRCTVVVYVVITYLSHLIYTYFQIFRLTQVGTTYYCIIVLYVCVCVCVIFSTIFKQREIFLTTLIWVALARYFAHPFTKNSNLQGWNK